MKPTRSLPAGLVLLALALPGLASAEDIVLATGTRYDATDVKLLPDAAGTGGSVQFAFRAQAGRGLVTLPYDRIEAHSLFDLAVARADASDPKAQLGLARLALARGLLGESTYRFRRVHLEPAGVDLPIERTPTGSSVTVPRLDVHAMVVGELEP